MEETKITNEEVTVKEEVKVEETAAAAPKAEEPAAEPAAPEAVVVEEPAPKQPAEEPAAEEAPTEEPTPEEEFKKFENDVNKFADETANKIKEMVEEGNVSRIRIRIDPKKRSPERILKGVNRHD